LEHPATANSATTTTLAINLCIRISPVPLNRLASLETLSAPARDIDKAGCAR
jgi:hypothetical protein